MKNKLKNFSNAAQIKKFQILVGEKMDLFRNLSNRLQIQKKSKRNIDEDKIFFPFLFFGFIYIREAI